MMDPLRIKEVFFNKKVLKTSKNGTPGRNAKFSKQLQSSEKKGKGYQLVSLLWQARKSLLFVC